jgi:hypothetical protein
MKLCGAGIFGPDSKLPPLLWISAAYARNDSVPDNPNKNVPTNGSGAHLVKMTEKSLRRRKLQNPPPELYVCDLIRRLKSATD